MLFVSHHADFVGGGEISQLQLLRALHAAGEDVALGVPTAGWCEDEAVAVGVPVLHLPMPAIGPLVLLPALRGWLKGLSGSARLELIHANTPRSCLYAGLAGRLLGIPVLFHCRISERDVRLDWLIGRLASRIVCNSRAVAARFAARHDKVEVIYNGLPEIEVEPAMKPWGAETVILFAGRLSAEKQPDMAVRAFARLADDFPRLHLAMVGGDDPQDPRYGDKVRNEASGLACADRIHWLGQSENMAAWYAIADLLVVPSRHEGFGRVIVEAMGCGIPVVAFAVGGIPEVMQDGEQGRLVQAGDEMALVTALHDMLSDAGLRRSMGVAGRERAQDFSLVRHVERMRAVFADVVAG